MFNIFKVHKRNEELLKENKTLIEENKTLKIENKALSQLEKMFDKYYDTISGTKIVVNQERNNLITLIGTHNINENIYQSADKHKKLLLKKYLKDLYRYKI